MNIPVQITTEDLLDRKQTVETSEILTATARHAIQLSISLLQPIAAMKWVDVLEMNQGEILCVDSSGKKNVLSLGPKITLLKGIKKILVSVASIGDSIDEKIHLLTRQGDVLLSYLLDKTGILALEQVWTSIGVFAEKEARKRCWGVGSILSPGSLDGWDLADQKTFCDLLPFDELNIRLTQNGTLMPFKTVTGIIGVGPGYGTDRVGSMCQYCNSKFHCRKHTIHEVRV